jgi:FkbM family methyltransferase
MKNPILVAARCYSAWRSLRAYPGVFSLKDAARHLSFTVGPGRFYQREMLQVITDELDIKTLPEEVHEIRVKRNGLVFYWLGPISCGLGGGVSQELDQEHPHFYNTPPVHLEPSSLILDVGTCDGLFALRVTKNREVANVVCFEPSARTADFLRQAAGKNGVADRIKIEVMAVGKDSRDVFFTNLTSPEGNHVLAESGAAATKVRQVSLDDYCRDNKIKLKPVDLIKVDAEGADVDVIKGAERVIREGSPQIAVTTYHDPAHAAMLVEYLHSVQPRYKLRVKGFTLWETTDRPRPVLLQAALPRNGNS